MKSVITILFLVVLATACQHEVSDEFHPYSSFGLNDTTWTRNSLASDFLDSISKPIKTLPIYTDSFLVSSDRKIKLNDSLDIAFPPYACADANGTLITDGKINLTLLFLQKKGDYIRHLISTYNNKYPLESSGSFYIKLTKNGQDVSLSNSGGYFDLTWKDNAPATTMKFFTGTVTANTDSLINWALNTTGAIKTYDSSLIVGSGNSKKGYDMKVYKQLGWFSSANLLDTTVTRTRLNVTLPLNYTNKNTMVFAVYKNKKTVIRLTADYASRSFFTQNIALNTSISLVSISLIDNVFYLGTKDVTVINANNFSVTPTVKSIADISIFLDNL